MKQELQVFLYATGIVISQCSAFALAWVAGYVDGSGWRGSRQSLSAGQLIAGALCMHLAAAFACIAFGELLNGN